MDAHGFPNEKLWAHIQSASDGELQSLAASGVASAQAFLESRSLIQGDDQAVTRMIVHGAKGNLFSLNLLSSYLATKPESRVSAYAISKAQERYGDTRTPLLRDAAFAQPLDAIERAEAEAEAIELYELMDSIRKSENIPQIIHPPSPRIKPDEKDFEKILNLHFSFSAGLLGRATLPLGQCRLLVPSMQVYELW